MVGIVAVYVALLNMETESKHAAHTAPLVSVLYLTVVADAGPTAVSDIEVPPPL